MATRTIRSEIDRLRSIHDASVPYIDHSGSIMALIEAMEKTIENAGIAFMNIHTYVASNRENDFAHEIGIRALNGIKITELERWTI